MFYANYKIILIGILLLCCSTIHATIEYEKLYFEVFGEPLIEKKVSKKFQLTINGKYIGLINIDYLDQSETISINKESFITLLSQYLNNQTLIQKIEKDFPNTLISENELITKGFITKTNIINQTIFLILPIKYNIKTIIDLNIYKKNKPENMPTSYIKPTLFSNYTNLYYKSTYDFSVNETTTKKLIYHGAAGIPLGSILYSGYYENRIQVNTLKLINTISSKDIAYSLGMAQKVNILSEPYLTKPNASQFIGLSIFDIKKNYQKERHAFDFSITKNATVSIYINNHNIYQKEHYPGKYSVINLPFKTYKNKVLLVIEEDDIITTQYTFLHNTNLEKGHQKYSIQFGYNNTINELLYETNTFHTLFTQLDYHKGLSHQITGGTKSYIDKSQHLNSTYINFHNILGISKTALVSSVQLKSSETYIGINQSHNMTIPPNLKKLFLKQLTGSINYFPTSKYTESKATSDFLESRITAISQTKNINSRLDYINKNYESDYYTIETWINKIPINKNINLILGSNYDSKKNNTIHSIQLNFRTQNQYQANQYSEIKYKSKNNQTDNNLTIKNDYSAVNYKLSLQQSASDIKQSETESNFELKNRRQNLFLGYLNYSLTISHLSETSDLITNLTVKTFEGSNIIFNTSLTYHSKHIDSYWEANAFLRYKFKLHNHEISPAIIQSKQYNGTKPSIDYSIRHIFNIYDQDHQLYVFNNVTKDNTTSKFTYNTQNKKLNYELTMLPDSINQTLFVNTPIMDLQFIEHENQLSSTIKTAIAITPQQIGVSNYINNGFVLFKPQKTLTEKIKINAISNSFGIFSAVGNYQNIKSNTNFTFIEDIKNNSPTMTMKGFTFLNSNKKYNNNIDFLIYEPTFTEISYYSYSLNNITQTSSETFTILQKPYRGYHIKTHNQEFFTFIGTIIDKNTGKLIPPYTTVTITSLNNKNTFTTFINENSTLLIDTIPPDYYILTIENYLPIYINAINFNKNSIINFGNIIMKPVSLKKEFE